MSPFRPGVPVLPGWTEALSAARRYADPPTPRPVRGASLWGYRCGSTQRCRVTRDGVVGAWSACNGERLTIGPLATGSYVFGVVATDERGVSDPTPASWAFTVA